MSDVNDPPPYSEAIKKPPEGFPPNPNMSTSQASAPPYSVREESATQQPNVIYVSPNVFGPRPVSIICSHCQHQIVTRTRPVSGLLTWLLCLLCIIFGCTLGCCFIPFCVEDCQDIEHTCPNCNAYLQQYKRIGN